MFDSVGSTELQDAGKAGLVTIQGKISAVLGTVLICKFFHQSLETSIDDGKTSLLSHI